MKNSRLKGHNEERAKAKEWREIGYGDCITKREARGGDWSTTDDGIDLVNTGNYDVQIKSYKNYRPVNTIEEVNGEGTPLVIMKANHKPTMAVLPWEALKELLALEREFQLLTKLQSPHDIPIELDCELDIDLF